MQRFLPLQDYPEHLFYADVLARLSDPATAYSRYYEADLRVGPYSAFYWLVLALAKVMSVEAAGKAVMSLYFVGAGLSVAGLDRLMSRRPGRPSPPWASLLVFPLLFNQEWYLGFTNYLLSLPPLLWILAEAGEVARRDRPPAGSPLRQTLAYLLLSLTHPFTLLVAAGAGLILPLRDPNDPRARRDGHRGQECYNGPFTRRGIAA